MNVLFLFPLCQVTAFKEELQTLKYYFSFSRHPENKMDPLSDKTKISRLKDATTYKIVAVNSSEDTKTK